MPYVADRDDSSSYSDYSMSRRTGSDTWVTNTGTLKSGSVTKRQYGWRTGKMYPGTSETEFLGSTLSDVRRRIKSMDSIYSQTMGIPSAGGLLKPVYDRDYTARESHASRVNLDYSRGTTSWGEQLVRGVTFWTNAHSANTPAPPLPSNKEAEGIAAGLLRASRPTAPHAELAVFLGELTSTREFINVSNYLPRNPRAAGGSYLNVNFGILPFVGDIRKLAEAVLRSRPIMRGFEEHAQQLVSRQRRTLTESTRTSLYARSQSLASGPFVDVYATSMTTQTISAFGTFRYYVGDPGNFLSRQQSYYQQAKYLLGLPLTASAAWEMVPFSFIVDWFTDVGGLLAYQEDVASDSLALLRSGFSTFSQTRTTYHGVVPMGKTTGSVPLGTCVSTRHSRRRGVNPYSLGLGGGMNPRRWAIAGALGLTKAPQTLW